MDYGRFVSKNPSKGSWNSRWLEANIAVRLGYPRLTEAFA
jgi:hypothetical protein